MEFKYQVGQLVTSKSGTLYKVLHLRSDNHPKLGGEIGYRVIAQRGGKDFGPLRLIRESALIAA